MYKHNIAEMEDTCVAKRRVSPVWINLEDDIVDKQNLFGCEVTHKTIRPDYCIIVDKVGVC